MYDPRREADERLNGSHDVYVLEPSPPAVREAPWFADDPAVPQRVGERPTVAPTTLGDVTWDELALRDPTLAPWCADRWLGAWRRLPHPPARLVGTRHSLHALAERVIAPYRYAKTGRIGLRWTRNGFGTPFLPGDEQIRVDEGHLVVRREGGEISQEVTTLREAADLLGIEPGVPDLYQAEHHVDPDVRLPVERNAADFLGEFFGLSASVLEQLRAEASPQERAATRVQLWPEHFDLAIELGDEATGRRAVYGASPGDDEHESPYFYVSPWSEVPGDPFWDATGFKGAALRLVDLVDVDDQRSSVLDFFRRGLTVLG